ncbi:hypothetical protein F8S12_16425 [Nostoc sp. WHI]|nr:hypothetical protein [Nostoc sp. WHI]
MQPMYRLVITSKFKRAFRKFADFSRYLKNLSLNLSPTRRETLNFPPSRVGKGVRGLGFRGLIHIT